MMNMIPSTPVAELHARLGCSNHRWPHCAGSVREESRYEDVAGEAAIDGTGSHILLELCIENNVPALHYDQRVIGINHHDQPNGWLVAPDRCKRVQMCLDYLERRRRELSQQYPGSRVIIESERRADPGGAFGRTDWWGTVDITITVFMNNQLVFIEVTDYKDGRIFVDVNVNTQLTSYLFGQMRPYIASGPQLVRPFNQGALVACRQTIVQPKTNPVIRYEDLDPSVVFDRAEDISDAAYLTDKPDAPVTPGSWCMWCKASQKRGGHCTAAAEKSLEVIGTMSTDIVPEGNTPLFEQISQMMADPKSLSDVQLAQLASTRDPLMAAYKTLDDEIEQRLSQGINVPGYTMAPGKNSNVWNGSEEEIAKALKGRRLKKDDIYPAKLLSPAQMMKLASLTDEQKKKLWDKFVTQKSGDLKLKRMGTDEVPHTEKDVGQCQTSDVKSAETMFAGVTEQPKSLFEEQAPEETTQPTISFM